MRGGSRIWMWAAIALAVLVLGAIGLVALRPTTVTVTPRSHTVLFDETALFSAYPAESAASGSLSFTVEEQSFEDSQVVPTEGVERVEEKASGSITVYNNYSTQSVKLIKNTRFETPEGLIFRTLSEVIVPGRKGAVPGEITITIFADAAGEKYNVGPISRLTIPGLKSTPAMYSDVYARSTSAMSGGFSGERAKAAPGAIDAARSDIRGRLEEKIRATFAARTDATAFIFEDLARTTFETLPQTAEAGQGVRIHERARVEIPVFSADAFAHIVAESVSAGAEDGGVVLRPGSNFMAHLKSTEGASLKSTSLQFSLSGTGTLVWKVDAEELAEALAGRDESAFQAIVSSFPGIEEARARIEPFWKNTFPADASDINIKIGEPKSAS